MDIAYEEIKSLEEKLINKVLYFALSDKYKQEIERAKEIFKNINGEEIFSLKESHFIPWLLWDFKLLNGNSFFEEYIKSEVLVENEQDIIFLNSLTNTQLSVYEIQEKNTDFLKLNNIFLNKEILVKDTLKLNILDINTLLLTRIYNYEDVNYIIDDYIIIDKMFKSVIEKGFYEKYEEYKEKYGFVSKEKFIENNSSLIYNFASIIEELTQKQLQNQDEFLVYQSTYIVINFVHVKNGLLSYRNTELDYEEAGNSYMRIYDDSEKILCEIVLNKNKLELECVTETDKEKARKIVEDLVGKFIKHLEDEIFYMEDIL